jgi:hypothetical protein
MVVGIALSLVLVVGRGAAAQVPSTDESIRLSVTAGLSGNSNRYDSPSGLSFMPSPGAELTTMVDRPLTAKWAMRAEASTVSWGVAPRLDYIVVGSRLYPVTRPADRYSERRVTLQVVKRLRADAILPVLAEFHAGAGVYWTGLAQEPQSHVRRAGGSAGCDLVIPVSDRGRVIAGATLDVLGLDEAYRADTGYMPMALSLRVGARIGF